MIAALRLLLGGIFKALAEIVAFIIEYWRIILPVAIVGLTLIYIFNLQIARDAAVGKLAAYEAAQKQAIETRKRVNETKQRISDALQKSVAASHQAVIDKIREDSNAKLTEQQKKSAAENKRLADSNDLWRERVRLELANNAARLSGLSQPAGELATIGANGDTTFVGKSYYDTLETACKITTADYNALWDAWASACRVYGCKK